MDGERRMMRAALPLILLCASTAHAQTFTPYLGLPLFLQNLQDRLTQAEADIATLGEVTAGHASDIQANSDAIAELQTQCSTPCVRDAAGVYAWTWPDLIEVNGVMYRLEEPASVNAAPLMAPTASNGQLFYESADCTGTELIEVEQGVLNPAIGQPLVQRTLRNRLGVWYGSDQSTPQSLTLRSGRTLASDTNTSINCFITFSIKTVTPAQVVLDRADYTLPLTLEAR